MLFQQKEGKVDGHAFILLAVAMKSVLGAVQTMHATGMTHRDIKPDNITLKSFLTAPMTGLKNKTPSPREALADASKFQCPSLFFFSLIRGLGPT